MTLHLLNRAPSAARVYAELEEAFSATDYLLLIEDGCYAALSSSRTLLAGFGGRVGVLEADAISRGLNARLDDSVERVDMEHFVTLTEHHPKTLSWF